MNYSIEEWQEIIKKCDVLEKLRVGISFKALAVDLKEHGYPCSGDAIRKAIKRLGYKKSNEQNLYYRDEQNGIIKFMNSVDVEEMTEMISRSRYYDCFKEWTFWERESIETIGIEIDKQIFEEYKKMSKKFGYDFDTEYMIYVLLKHLNEIDPKDREKEFIRKAIEELGEAQVKFIYEKEKQGYDLFALYTYADSEGNLLDLSEEEFKSEFRKTGSEREAIK